ncbi:MAG: sulfurtransferase TusA family protein, partial [Treponema sp.]|nr:sulfurtransferase TusA family protein [Treponema sp.]
VNAKKAAEELKAGDVLTVLVDNEIAVQNLTRFAEHKGAIHNVKNQKLDCHDLKVSQ